MEERVVGIGQSLPSTRELTVTGIGHNQCREGRAREGRNPRFSLTYNIEHAYMVCKPLRSHPLSHEQASLHSNAEHGDLSTCIAV